MKNEIIYDIEIFKKMALVSFLDDAGKFVSIIKTGQPDTRILRLDEVVGYVDDIRQSLKFATMINNPNYLLIGANNHHYDDLLLKDLLLSQTTTDLKNLKAKSDVIVSGSKDAPRPDFEFATFDVFEQMPMGFSLKKWEAMAGLSVLESDINFDYNDEFTDAQILDVLKYNLQDVKSTSELYKFRHVYFSGKKLLVKNYGEQNSERLSNGTIASRYLMGRGSLLGFEPETPLISDELPPEAQDFLKMALKTSPIIDQQPNKKAKNDYIKNHKIKSTLQLEAFDNVVTFGFGGLHSAKGHIKKTAKTERPIYDIISRENVYQLDVTSMFPSIIIANNLLGIATKKYENLVKDRIKNKATGNPLAQSQKIIINSVYGLLRLKGSPLFNPKSAIFVNVFGQSAIFTLANRLYQNLNVEILQINTDGVTFCAKNNSTLKTCDIMDIVKGWEHDFSLGLELDTFKKLIQADVNNYIADFGDHFKLKGGSISQGIKRDNTKASGAVIVQKMIFNKLVYDSDPLDVLKKASLIDLCFTLSTNKTTLSSGRIVNEQGQPLAQRVNRVIATTDGTTYLKEKKGGGVGGKFPDAPEKMALMNNDLQGCSIPKNIDYNYYMDLYAKKIKKWGL